MPGAITRRAIAFLGDSSAIAALEFGLAAPLVVLLFIGGFDMSRYLLVHYKVERVAFAVADILTQYKMVSGSEIKDAFTASAEIMHPFPFGPEGVVIVSSVHRSEATGPTVIRWQCSGGGALARTSAVGRVNGTATLPGELTLGARDNVIVSEVFYTYRPIFSGIVPDQVQVYKTSVFRPRLGALTSAPGC
ncbi:TadE/TadG family type IV pilus assembly protein [Faunimonas sp. B44]|uniref:TadE/TadG family type IV pilus assembly protein n=1 Tax=Faunimonas sp. B44 TaxID=3461493 RepID=UPI0040450F49